MRKDSKRKPTRDYEVGCGKPPVHSRWKPGQPGNPKGRPSLSGDPAENIHKILNEEVVVSSKGVPTRMAFGEALMRQIAKDALAGKASARREIIRLFELQKQRVKDETDTGFLTRMFGPTKSEGE